MLLRADVHHVDGVLSRGERLGELEPVVEQLEMHVRRGLGLQRDDYARAVGAESDGLRGRRMVKVVPSAAVE